MREEDSATPTLWIHAGDDVLEESIIGASLWRDAVHISPVGISLPGGAIPLFDRVGRICQHNVETSQVIAFDKFSWERVSPRSIWKSSIPCKNKFIRAIAEVIRLRSCP